MPKTFEDDWIAFPHPNGILGVLRGLLVERFLPVPCFLGVVPGEVVALDYVDDQCGAMGWARVQTVYPSSVFPNQDQSTSKTAFLLASVIEVGIVRGAVIPDNGEAPTADEQFDMARLQMADMNAIVYAICSYCDAHDIPVVMGTYTPVGPDGGVVGGTWTATLAAV